MKFNRFGSGGENPGNPATEVNNTQVIHSMADGSLDGPFCGTAKGPDGFHENAPFGVFKANKQS